MKELPDPDANEELFETPGMRLNRMAGVLMGQKIRNRRLELKLTSKAVAVRCGSANTRPKQFMSHIEKGTRQRGLRLGTIYALAQALECQVVDLLPSSEEVMKAANIKHSDSLL